MRGIIDRFEGEYAVVETAGKIINVQRKLIPQDASEGDIVDIADAAVIVNKHRTCELKREIDNLMDEVWKE